MKGNRFNLLERATLGAHYIQNMTDANLNHLPYWMVEINKNPAYAKHCRVDDAELAASWCRSLVLVERMGIKIDQAILEDFKHIVLREFREDGLRYHHKYPWTSKIFCNIHEMGYVLGCLVSLYERDGDKHVREKATGLVAALRRIVIAREERNFWAGDFPQERKSYFFPNDNYYEDGGYKPSHWTGRGEEVIRNAVVIPPLVDWFALTGDETAQDLAEGLINHLVYESRKFDYRQAYIGHVHSIIWIACGVIRYGMMVDNKELVEWGKTSLSLR